MSPGPPVENLLASLRANSCGTHGPLPPGPAAALLVERAAHHASAAGGSIAVTAGDPLLDELSLGPALAAAGLTLVEADDPDWRGRLPGAAVGITGSVAAVAEQGVLALDCAPGRPRGVSLLPAVHLCAVRTADVVATFAEAIERFAATALPSALTWVGGPSRTGDIEMVLTLGVHGPKVVEVVLVGPADPAV